MKRLKNTSLTGPCLICGSDEMVEIHHIKPIRRSDKSDRSRVERKQIPVCKKCHIRIHRGGYDGISLNELRKEIPDEPQNDNRSEVDIKEKRKKIVKI